MKSAKYVAKTPDSAGFIEYDEQEQQTWGTLFNRQNEVIQNRACQEFIDGIDTIGLNAEAIPQLPDVNNALKHSTGWAVEAVPALIPFDYFFELLASKRFPAATFIRRPEDMEYLQEPDIFHEIYGHCPLLSNQFYADFTEAYGKLGLKSSKAERRYLARLYWFTVEFGLIQKAEGLRIYGGGILSSIGETTYSLESEKPERKQLVIQEALRTPYRIDIYQSVYFIINSFEQLSDFMHQDLIGMVHQAIELGDYAPTFPPKDSDKPAEPFDIC